MKNNQKIEIFAGQKAPDSNLGMLWLDTSAPAAKLKKLNKDGSVEILNPTIPPIPAPVELSTSLTETLEGKAADATVIKTLNDSKYPSLQNGSGNPSSTIGDTVQDLVAMGFSLSGANLQGAGLSSKNLEGANLSNADLSSAYLSSSNLSNSDLTNANLASASLSGVYLEGANLTNANLSNANSPGARLGGANLSNANLSSAILPGVNLSSANLEGANLEDVTLSNADLSGANLSGANLSNVVLPAADLSNALGLDADINVALADVNKDPSGNGTPWSLIWTDEASYSCDPSTGLFTVVP